MGKAARKKERGIFLTLVIAFQVLAFIRLVLHPQSLLSPPINIFFLVLGIIALYGIWMWKKWGVYLQIITAVVGFVNVFVIHSNNFYEAHTRLNGLPLLVFTGSVYLVVVAIIFWAYYRKWRYFE
jgi:hypothetical protein